MNCRSESTVHSLPFQKGSGYHLDMLILAVLVVILSVLGLPWYVAATVTALAHIMSLRKESECTAPGEKPMFLGIREQRVTNFLVGVFSGLAVLITSVLQVKKYYLQLVPYSSVVRQQRAFPFIQYPKSRSVFMKVYYKVWRNFIK